jgi:hypothetical protein
MNKRLDIIRTNHGSFYKAQLITDGSRIDLTETTLNVLLTNIGDDTIIEEWEIDIS